MHAGSLAIKFYTSSIPKSTCKENDSSSNIRNGFMNRDGSASNSARNFRERWKESLKIKPIKGMFRIHIVLPEVRGGTPKSCIQGNDVMIYSNRKNMGRLFEDNSVVDIRGGQFLNCVIVTAVMQPLGMALAPWPAR